MEPTWLDDVVEGSGGDFSHTSRDGRTYLASRCLADGRGAFGFLAVTVADEDPLWLNAKVGGGDEGNVAVANPPSDAALDETSPCENQSPTLEANVPEDIKEVLANRPGPEERAKLLDFHQSLLDDVDAVLRGEIEPGEHLKLMLSKLHENMANDRDQEEYDRLPNSQKITILLHILRKRVVEKISEVQAREAKLDDATQRLLGTTPQAEVEDELLHMTDSEVLWNQAANRKPKKLEELLKQYPKFLIGRFLTLLAQEKKSIVEKFREHHITMVNSMKDELQKEVQQGLDEYMNARDEWIRVSDAMKAATQAQKNALALSKEEENVHDEANRWDATAVDQMTDQLKESKKRFQDESSYVERLSEEIEAERKNTKISDTMNNNAILQLETENLKMEEEAQDLEDQIKVIQDGILVLKHNMTENGS